MCLLFGGHALLFPGGAPSSVDATNIHGNNVFLWVMEIILNFVALA